MAIFATRRPLLAMLAACTLTLSACATAGPGQPVNDDPLEPFNRAVFTFNTAVDEVVLQPVARGYRYVTPRYVRNSVHNFLQNLNAPVVFANDVLQLDFERAMTTLFRFLANTTFGIAGTQDVASEMGLMPHSEDFGQTLGHYGAGEGFYLVLPLLGPSSARDATGRVVDFFLDPINWWVRGNAQHDVYGVARTGAEVISGRERLLDTTDRLERTSADYYAAIRSLYRQRREAEIRNRPSGSGGDLDLDLDAEPKPGNDAGSGRVAPNSGGATKPQEGK